jgi:hypothetical protein
MTNYNYVENATLTYGNCQNEKNNTIPHKDGIKMIGCQYCKISSCSISNVLECPFNQLWEKSVIHEKPKFELDELLTIF